MGFLGGILDSFSDDALAKLERRDELGEELNFLAAVDDLRIARDVLVALDKEDPAALPTVCRSEVSSAAEQLRNFEEQILAFSARNPDADNGRNTILSGIATAKDSVTTWRGQIRSDAVALLGLRETAEGALADAKEASAVVKTASEEWEPLKSEIRQRLGEIAANDLSAKYRKQAVSHQNAAQAFMVLTVLAAALTLVAAGILFAKLKVPDNLNGTKAWVELTRDLVERLFFLGLLSFIITFLARNYRVNKHLQVVNEQKRNALDTFPLFAEATLSDDARNVIVVELVKTVFSPADTGFLGGDVETTIIDGGPSLLGLLANRAGSSS